MTRLIFVRHGETDWNKRKILQGTSDIELNKNGLEQARKVALRLKSEKIDVIYSSPLKRAYQTACAIAGEQGIEVIRDDDLREVNYGVFEGRNIDELKNDELWKERKKDKYNFKPPGGESYKEFFDKTILAIKRILKDNRGKTILISSHSAFIRSALIKVMDMDVAKGSNIRIYNTSVTEIEFMEDKPVLKVLNNSDHI
ncbi:MAG: histidine phosphatase family protein [Candidatus Aenigmarchaeota archaeon]|nr:histidine phosphatase family protein [Candidatus Aenigmarchaeota archaeon]